MSVAVKAARKKAEEELALAATVIIPGRKPERPAIRDLHRSVITIKVGKEPALETFVIHKELISHYSAFFRSCTRGSWLESETGTVNLPDDRTDNFKVFEAWLYTQKMILDDEQKNQYRFSIDLFIFANKIQACEFQNACLDLLYQRFNDIRTLYSPYDICHVWENTVEGSPLRTYLVHLYTYDCRLNYVLDAQSQYPAVFVRLVLNGFIARVPTRLPGEKTPYEENMELYYVWDPSTQAVAPPAGVE